MIRKIILTGIIKCEDKFLIIKRSDTDDFLPGVWEFSGGNLEDGELLLEGLKRELKEEIGIVFDVEKSKLVHHYDKIKGKENDIVHKIELDFLLEVESTNIEINLSEEHSEYKWVTKDSELLDDFIKQKIM